MNRILSNVAWRFAEQISSYSVTFIVSIIIARILAPEDYGSIAIIMVFITLANIFVQNGFSAALIQKKNADNLDFSSIFYFILAFSTVLYAILFVISPYVALYYNSDVLCPALRVLGLRLIIGTVNTVQQAVIAKKMIFRKNFFSTLGGNVVSGILGLVAAYAGLGLWALIIQNLSHLIVTTIILWYTVKWRPILAFSWRRLKGLLDFGWKLMASALAGAIYDDLRTLIIGKVYSKSDLAYYSRGQQFPQLIMNNVNNAVSSVTFPVLSEKQDNKDDLANSNRRLIQIMSGVISPLLVGLAIVAEPLVHIILTDKWLPCVPFLRVCCIFYWLTCIYNAYLTSYKAIVTTQHPYRSNYSAPL
ncbi:lipopolysaccharide biosynthesis protein [Segatella copri]|uniref:lipopolysaccharide biosynthesis protein n=1 Tax=Segatella copri TaxID=165179 RepID=UPI003F9C8F65